MCSFCRDSLKNSVLMLTWDLYLLQHFCLSSLFFNHPFTIRLSTVYFYPFNGKALVHVFAFLVTYFIFFVFRYSLNTSILAPTNPWMFSLFPQYCLTSSYTFSLFLHSGKFQSKQMRQVYTHSACDTDFIPMRTGDKISRIFICNLS